VFCGLWLRDRHEALGFEVQRVCIHILWDMNRTELMEPGKPSLSPPFLDEIGESKKLDKKNGFIPDQSTIPGKEYT
jgi:hypothetical protein